jgi:uncharacterized protein YndB with AHSA1/START domain
MTEGTFPVTIQAPPDVVWPWVSQLEKHAQWSPKPYRFEWLSGQPNAVGSRYRSVGWVPGNKNNVNEGEITANVPNERFALRADDPQGSFQNTFTLRPAAGGTEVTFHLVFPTMKPPMNVLAAMVFATVGRADVRKRMQLLKQKVEGTA